MLESKRIGPFQIVRQLGRGGMGSVYEAIPIARDPSSELPSSVALKLLLDQLEDDSEIRSRFEAEIETLKKLRHPNIVRIYGFGQEEGLLYYAMEYVAGPSLQDLQKKKVRLTWEQVLHIGIKVASALRHAHDRGIIHRDIKPANILLADGQIKVSDYGIARFFGGSHLTDANMVIGTIEYMAPEQASAGPLTPKSDIYSLGAMLYSLLTGVPPYTARTLPEILKKYQSGPPESIRFTRPEVPVILDLFILELLKIHPSDRPANAGLVQRRLETIRREFIKEEINPFLVKKSSLGSSQEPSFSAEEDYSALENDSVLHLDRPSELSPPTSEQASAGLPTRSVDLRDDRDPGRETMDFSTADSIMVHTEDFDQTVASSIDVPLSSKARPMEHPYFPLLDSDTDQVQKALPETIYTDALEGDGAESFSEKTAASSLEQSISEPTIASAVSPGNEEQKGSIKNPAAQPSQTNSKTSHFTYVHEEERDTVARESTPAATSIGTWIFSVILLLVGFGFWYQLRAPSADKLYSEIAQKVENSDDESEYLAALRAIEPKMNRFLTLYSNDGRSEKVRQYVSDLELGNLERRLERQLDRKSRDSSLTVVEYVYLGVLETVKEDPEEGIVKLKAFIDLFSSELTEEEDASTVAEDDETGDGGDESQEESSGKSIRGFEQTHAGQCVQLAIRRLEKCQNELDRRRQQEKEVIASRLERAQSLRSSDPQKAQAMEDALKTFYGDCPWAADLLNPEPKEE